MNENSESIKKNSFFYNLKIRSKLISIISLIIITSLSSMIILASFFFRSDNELRIKENTHQISSVLALKIRADFTAITGKLNLMGTTMQQEFKSKKQKQLFTDLFFSNDKDFIFVGISEAGKNGKVKFKDIIYNKNFYKESKISSGRIKKTIIKSSKVFANSVNGEAVVHNFSDDLRIPVIGISIPFQRGKRGEIKTILISLIKLDNFLQTFSDTGGITKSFMVNNKGDIIAHPNSKIVLSAGNLINIPIVRRMLKSKINNGQGRYQDKDKKWFLGSFKKIDFAGIGIISTVPEKIAFQAVEQIQRRNIYITIIILNIAILIVYFFSKTITTPIIRLLGATKEIEQGNFQIDINPVSGDEIGALTKSFVSMGHGLEEREKMKDAFGKFVNEEIAEQAMRGELKLGGERTQAAVFFSDIRSFTAISEKLEPEEVVEFLNQYMTRMVNCINDTDGYVDKYIGDAIMAIWGAPLSKGNDTENAINGGLLMRKELIKFNVGRGGPKKPIIKIGSGINTGPVLAGQIGSEEKMEYTVIGDTVNLASRIEALNKPFATDLLISTDSYNIVKDIFRCVPMKKIKVKGKTDPQQIYAVLGRYDDPNSPKTIEEMRKIVGIEFKGEIKEDAGAEVKYEIIE